MVDHVAEIKERAEAVRRLAEITHDRHTMLQLLALAAELEERALALRQTAREAAKRAKIIREQTAGARERHRAREPQTDG